MTEPDKVSLKGPSSPQPASAALKGAYKKPLVIIVLAAAAAGGWLWFGGDSAKTTITPIVAPAVIVKTASVQREDVPELIRAVGTVIPNQTVGIRSRIDSQITAVKFHDGDAVKAGDTLFLLDDRTLKAQLVQQQANLDRDLAQLDNAQRQYNRIQKLAEQGYAAHADRDTAKANFATAQANVGADRAALENIQVQLGYTVITAPIDGRTGTISVTVGNEVKANDVPLVTINQIQPILMQASLPQSAFDALRTAMQAGKVTALATRDGAQDAVSGTVAYLDNAIDQGTGTFVTRAAFDNKDEHLWPGMLGTLTIEVGILKQVVTVPEVAIQHTGSDSSDFVFISDNGNAKKVNVTVSEIQGGKAVVASGLQPGEQVVTDGIMSLRDGTPVKQAEAAGGKAAKPADHD